MNPPVVSVSLVLLLGAVLLIALRYTRLRLWHAAVSVAFGFCLGKSVESRRSSRTSSRTLAAEFSSSSSADRPMSSTLPGPCAPGGKGGGHHVDHTAHPTDRSSGGPRPPRLPHPVRRPTAPCARSVSALLTDPARSWRSPASSSPFLSCATKSSDSAQDLDHAPPRPPQPHRRRPATLAAHHEGEP